MVRIVGDVTSVMLKVSSKKENPEDEKEKAKKIRTLHITIKSGQTGAFEEVADLQGEACNIGIETQQARLPVGEKKKGKK